MNDQLNTLGDALRRAVAQNLSTTQPRSRRLLWRSPKVAALIAAGVVAVPAVAYAANSLLSDGQVAASLPAGTRALIGTDPTCTTVLVDVEYHCVLASPPSNLGAPGGGSTSGTYTVPSVTTGASNNATFTVTSAATTTTSGGTYTLPPGASAAPAHGPLMVKVAESNGRTVLVHVSSAAALKADLRALASGGKVSVRVVSVTRAGLVQQPAAHNSGTTTTAGTAAWTGTVEPTVDASKHVNGGCRAQNAQGTVWECYIGEAAVQQNIIGQGFLGAYAPSPGVG